MRRLIVALVFLTLPAGAGAQEDSLLAAAQQLSAEGRGDSARALVRARLQGLSPLDSLYPRALFAAGVVAQDADSAGTYFRRVSIEYSSSPWADSALLRLAQLAFAGGDYVGTQRSTQRVLMDYPLSPLLAEASYWAGRAQLELDDTAEGCRLLARAAELAGENVELANRARFYRQRCPAVAAARADTERAAPGTAPEPGDARGPRAYAVQVAAIRSAAAADDLMRRLNAAGYDPHVLRDVDGLLKVRVGRFGRHDEAQRLVAELRRRFGGNPFVVEES